MSIKPLRNYLRPFSYCNTFHSIKAISAGSITNDLSIVEKYHKMFMKN